MKMEMKVEIQNKEIIKPSSPTPLQLQHFNLSLLDQRATASYVPVILFFANPDTDTDIAVPPFDEISKRLKKSLSETLTRFYPLAGRARENSFVDCNDEGVDYIEARVNCPLSDFLKEPTPEELLRFLPVKIESDEAVSGRMFLIQVTLFECGGMAIGASFSHKLGDASSISTILKSWSAAALGSHTPAEPPKFLQATLLPPPQGIPISVPPTDLGSKHKCISKRLVFTGPKLAALKAASSSAESITKPTRVEAVTALIWKAAMKAAKTTSGEALNLTVMSQTVNLRKRLTPPLPETSIGNLLGNFVTDPIPAGEKKLEDLVGLLRDGIREFNEKGVERYQGKDAFLKIIEGLQNFGGLYGRDDVAFYICSSWNRFGLYEVDFGWGNPTWVSIGSIMFLNFVVLMDMKDGEGIEAWVTLKEEEMSLFERAEELLKFALVNPSVV